MKKIWCLLLATAVCLTLWGCRSSDPEQSTGEPAMIGTEPETPEPSDGPLSVMAQGKTRIEYTGKRSGVRYIITPDALPDHEALVQYDEAFFREHALVLVTETVPSGSIQVGIDAIQVSGDTACVTLFHKDPGGEGTADMATWLLWVEVDAGLECSWVLENPALTSDAVTK